MRLWLLDADVIIKLLELDVFNQLAGKHELNAAFTVTNEVKYYRRKGQKISVNFRQTYITPVRVSEVEATVEEMQDAMRRLPPLKQQALHAGEPNRPMTIFFLQARRPGRLSPFKPSTR